MWFQLCRLIHKRNFDIPPSFRSIIAALPLTVCPIWLLKILVEDFTNLVLSIKNRGRRKSGECIEPVLKIVRVHINFNACHCLRYRVLIMHVIILHSRKQTAANNIEARVPIPIWCLPIPSQTTCWDLDIPSQSPQYGLWIYLARKTLILAPWCPLCSGAYFVHG